MEEFVARQKRWVEASITPHYDSATMKVAIVVNSFLITGTGGLVIWGPANAEDAELASCLAATFGHLACLFRMPPRRDIRGFIDRHWPAITEMTPFKWRLYQLEQGVNLVGAIPVDTNGKPCLLSPENFPARLREQMQAAAQESGWRRSVVGIPYRAARSAIRFAQQMQRFG